MVETIFVASIAGATLAFELLQTRVLSTLYYHHYYHHVVYVTVTIALLGFGISGVAISLLGRRLAAGRARELAAYAGGAFVLGMAVCLAAASHIPTALPGLPALAKLLLSYLVLVVPFLFAGAALGLVFMASGRRIHRLYAADLAASAAAALAFCLLLTPLGAAGLAWLCVAVAVAAAAAPRPRLAVAAVPAVLAAVFLLAPDRLVGERPEAYKTAGRFYQADWDTERLLASVWTTTARIDVWSDPARDLETGRALRGRPPPYLMVTQDNDAHTNMLGPAERRRVAERVARGEPVEPLDLLYPLLGRPPGAVLVIGAGGGKDVVIAKAYGARSVDAVELNPATVDLVSGRFTAEAAWPAWEGVRLVAAEGRHFVRTAGKTYDAIVMSGVDTFAALSSGAYVLSENHLYTVEAIRDYLAALEPGSILGVYRWLFRQPRESLRLANLYLQAAAELGIAHPERSLMVVAGRDWAATLVKNGAFTPGEVATALARAGKKEEFGLVFVPRVLPPAEQARLEARAFAAQPDRLRPAREAYAGLLEAATEEERRAFEAAYPYNIAPVRDDRPFFFEYFKPAAAAEEDGASVWAKGGLGEGIAALRGDVAHHLLPILLALAGAIGFGAMILPLLAFDRQGLRVGRGPALAGYFAALGLGFMLVEVGLMQKLGLYLGHPMHAVAVVLAGALLFAGLGAFLGERLPLDDTRKIAVGMLGTALLVGAWLTLGQRALAATAGWPLAGRVAACLATIGPLATAMGVPFATGLRYLARRHPAFIPWAWGVNGLASVLGSVAAILVAMRAGFTAVLLAGAGVYGLGLLAFLLHRRPVAWRAAGQPSAGSEAEA